MIHIIIDGDNISVDKYIEHILPILKLDEEYKTTVIVQNNFKVKYISSLNITVNIEFTKTKHKNATDSRILFETGKSIQREEKVIIISNDRIFEELDESSKDISLYGYNKITSSKGLKLKKKNIVASLLHENEEKKTHEDVFLSDFQFKYFTHIQKEILQEYIESHISDIEISSDECVYFKKNSKYCKSIVKELV